MVEGSSRSGHGAIQGVAGPLSGGISLGRRLPFPTENNSDDDAIALMNLMNKYIDSRNAGVCVCT